MDLTKLSDADLIALQSGNLTKVSDAGLAVLSGKPVKREPDAFDRQVMEDAKINPALKAGAEVLGGATSIMRGGTNIIGSIFGKSKLGQEIWPTQGLDKDSAGYLVGSLLDPVSYATGAKAFQLAGKLPVTAKALPYVQGLIGGGAAGGITGAVSEEGSAGTGAVLGALTGAAAPAVIQGGQKLAQIVRPLTKSGTRESAGRMVNEIVGDKYDDVLGALQKPNTPFANPTVGQATANLNLPELAALQKVSQSIAPNAPTQTLAAQRAGREGLLKSFAGTDDEIAAMREALKLKQAADAAKLSQSSSVVRAGREAAVMPPVPGVAIDPAMKGVGGAGVRVAGETPKFKSTPGLESLKQNPGMQAAIADAKNMAAGQRGLDSGLTPQQIDDIIADPTKSFEGLRLIKAAIDDRFKTGVGIGDSSLAKIDDRTLTNLKKSFMGVAESAAPGWNAALKEWGQESNKIFQKEVGKNMLTKLQKPLGEGETGANLARAIESETQLVKKSGGFGRAGLDDQLTPQNAEAVSKVIGQLDIDTKLSELANMGMRSKKLGDTVGPSIELPNLMNQGVAITNSLIRRVFGITQVRTLREMSELMQNPEMMAQMMAKANAREKNALRFLENSMKYVVPQLSAKSGELE